VAGVAPSPVKRYRPGAPPASPHIGARALPVAASPTIVPIAPWYRRVAPWSGILIATAAIVVALVVLVTSGSDGSTGPTAGNADRPPAAAPRGTKIMSGNTFGIAVPDTWAISDNPGQTFGQLHQERWNDVRVATSTDGAQGILVAQLRRVKLGPLTDPDVFWSDQIVGINRDRTVSQAESLGVHGLSGNEVVITEKSGAESVLAAAVETSNGIDLIAVRAPTQAAAKQRFTALYLTFYDR
jgi:hypothetical protein